MSRVAWVVLLSLLAAAAASVTLALWRSGSVTATAFRGLSAAQHARTGVSQLPLAVVRQITSWNAATAIGHARHPRFDWAVRALPSTARIIGRMPNGSPVVVLADDRGELCLFGGLSRGCGPPLTRADPIIFSVPKVAPPGTPYYLGGIALDGVTSVSFRVWNKNTTVAVKHNFFLDETPHSTSTLVYCLSAHFADGSTYREPNDGHNCGSR